MRSSFVRAMSYQSATKFLPGSRWFLGSLHQFIIDEFGDLILQELESHGIIGSGTNRLPPAPVQVGLINEAQLKHGHSELWKMDSDPTGDQADHTLVVPVATTDPIYQSSPMSDSKGDREVYMVGNGEELPDKMVEEIQQETDEERTQATHLAREAKREKRHNGL
jgi:hypothetical protein